MASSVLSQPKIVDVHTVNPEIIAVRIAAQETIRGQQIPYIAEAGDRIEEDGWVRRNGEYIGVAVGADQSLLRLPDQIHGLPLDTAWADDLTNYRISSTQDANYDNSLAPVAVYRKSKPIGSQLAFTAPKDAVSPLTHTVYLKLPTPLQVGETYDIDFLGDQLSDVSYRYEPTVDRSEAVHVSQIGFDPGDGAKVAFLSQWMGNGGDLEYAEGTKFWLIDEATGAQVYEGQIELAKAKNRSEDSRRTNYNLTDVYIMDFSDFQTEGTFRVAVEGVGTSFAFEIGENTWEDAFYTSARGFFHQRSGIALEQPYTDYERPRPFHPDDGVKVYQSTVPLMDTDMGLNLQNLRAFDALTDTRTDQLVSDAWGGWFDAGDWDRRIQHLEITRNLLDLATINPDYFQTVDLNIVESNNQIADIVDEALWGLDVFRRLQTPEGGIPGGIESAGHPKLFSASWQESQPIMVYGPGIWSSYIYTATAAQAAVVLKSVDPVRSQMYQDSALRAMAWAEQEYSTYTGPTDTSIDNWRNLAALDLYRLTQDTNWHQLFLETTVFTDPGAEAILFQSHNHEEAAYIYAQLDLPEVDPTVRENAYQALLRAGDAEIENIEKTGFKWQKNPHVQVRYGSSMGHPDVTTLLRVHQLSGDNKYLNAAILGLQFTAGANPDNLVFTTGLGHRSPQDPLIVDVRATGSDLIPPGITLYGPYDYDPPFRHSSWRFFEEGTFPAIKQWPTTENYFDIYSLVPVTEFTVHQTMAPTSYGFGYLAAVDYGESSPDDEDPGNNGEDDTPPTDPTDDGTTNEDPDTNEIGGDDTDGDNAGGDDTPTTDPPGITINGTKAAEELEGGAGNDTIDGQGRNDTLRGLAGDDVLIGSWGWDTLDGGQGNDRLVGGPGQDTYTGGVGQDAFVLSADNAQDTITDFVVGEDWIDISEVTAATALDSNGDGLVDGSFLTTTGEGDLTLDLRTLGGGPLVLQGLASLVNNFGLDLFAPPTGSDDTTDEEPDNNGTSGEDAGGDDAGDGDTPTTDPTDDDTDDTTDETPDNTGGDDTGGEDAPSSPGVTITGTKAAEQLEGSAGNDTIDGQGRNDTIYGLAGDDVLIGSWGWDTLDGGQGNDRLVGGPGKDTYTGGVGQDAFVLSADNAQDIITDFVVEEDWIDISEVTAATALDSNGDGLVDDSFLSTTGEGDLTLDLSTLGGGPLLLEGLASLANNFGLSLFAPPADNNDATDEEPDNAGGDGGGDDAGGDDTPASDPPPVPGVTITGTKAAEELEGGAGNDTIDGQGRNDTLRGLAGDDVLMGNWGWDTLDGGQGNDRLVGGPGQDIYTGGAGQDVFVLHNSSGQTTITDFETDADRLDIGSLGISFGTLDANNDNLVDQSFVTIQTQGVLLDLSSFGGGPVLLQGDVTLESRHFI